jgi:hypothetical protein
MEINMSTGTIPIKGYLIHIYHYDPAWYQRRDRQEPFDLKIGCEVVDAVADAGLNMLAIDLDDGVVFRSHPELKRHYSVPMAHLQELVAKARQRKLEIVPKLNFSKSSYHRHNDWFSPHHQLEDTDEYWRMAFEVIDEVLDTCRPERFFFIGMDEDTHRTDRQYVSAVKRLRAELKQRKLRAAMWNDTPHLSSSMFQCVRKTLAAEDNVATDVVQTVWDYGPVRRRAMQRVRDIRQKGFEVWIAPGTNPEHVRDWKQVALDNGCTGMLMTMWQPVHHSTREEMLKRIRTLGPIYSSQGESRQIAVIESSHVVAALADSREKGTPLAEQSVLAPNFLKRTRAKLPYLLPSDVFLRNWTALGPFAFKPADYKSAQQQEVIDDSRFLDGHEAELVAKPDGTPEFGAKWRKYQPPAGSEFPQVIDLAQMYGAMDYALAYLVAHVHSAADAPDCRLCLGSDDYVKVWLNGALLYTYSDHCRAVSQDEDVVEGVALRKGWNTLLVKCVNIRATWGLMARFAAAKGRAFVTTIE